MFELYNFACICGLLLKFTTVCYVICPFEGRINLLPAASALLQYLLACVRRINVMQSMPQGVSQLGMQQLLAVVGVLAM